MSDALEHVRYSCGIAGEEVANYVDQLQARVAELEAEREGIKQALISDYYFSGLPIAYSVGELVAGYKDRNKSAHVFMQQLNETEKQNAELEAEVERLKRTNSSYANLTKAQESQLTNLRQRLYQLKGADSAIDSERQANCDLTEQLAAEQLNNKLLRKALKAVIKAHGYESGIPVEAISTPASTEALDKYVVEKVKEAGKFDVWKTNPYTKVLETSIEQLTKQRDLAVEALEKTRGALAYVKANGRDNPNLMESTAWHGLAAADKALATIKESEVK